MRHAPLRNPRRLGRRRAGVVWVAATSLLLVSLVLTIQTGIPAVPGVLAAVVMLCFPLASLGGSL